MVSTHHSFDIELASEYGIQAAIIIHHFQHWINHNRASGKNFRDGRTWSFQTRKEIADWFPYLSPHQVRRLTDKLVKEKVLIKGNWNKKANDDTIWYAFVDEDKYLKKIEKKPVGKSANPKSSSVDEIANRVDENANPLPDTKQDTSSLTVGSNQERPKMKLPDKGKTKTVTPKVERATYVKTTNDEHNRLIRDFGEGVVHRAYEKLSVWKIENPKKWKVGCDDNLRLRRWAIGRVQDEDLQEREREIKRQELKQREERIQRIDSEKNGKSNSNPCLSEQARRQYDDAF